MADKALNLYQKIAKVMESIEYLSKDGKVEFGNTRYKAMTEEKVTTTVRKELIAQGLVVFPIEQESRRSGHLTSVDTKYKIVNVDNTAEYEILASSGEGADTQDKGVGKAMTYAFKYVLLRTFAIPTGEDPDKISSEELTEMFKEEEALEKPQRPASLETRADKLNYITDLVKSTYGIEGFCTQFKISKIGDLTDDRLDNCIKHLESL